MGRTVKTYFDKDGVERLNANVPELNGIDVSQMTDDDIKLMRKRHYSRKWNQVHYERKKEIDKNLYRTNPHYRERIKNNVRYHRNKRKE